MGRKVLGSWKRTHFPLPRTPCLCRTPILPWMGRPPALEPRAPRSWKPPAADYSSSFAPPWAAGPPSGSWGPGLPSGGLPARPTSGRLSLCMALPPGGWRWTCGAVYRSTTPSTRSSATCLGGRNRRNGTDQHDQKTTKTTKNRKIMEITKIMRNQEHHDFHDVL